jgi:hypothetical protein
MNVWPLGILAVVAMAFGVTVVVDRYTRHRRSARLFALARTVLMNYSPLDRFDLGSRLRSRPEWLTDSTDLYVRDVLYATCDGDRHFVATATRRHTADERPRLFLIRCRESLIDHALHETAPRREVTDDTLLDAYREATGAQADAAHTDQDALQGR